MLNDFESKLQDFQLWATAQNPDFGRLVSQVISSNYISQLGDATASPAEDTVKKLGDLLNTVGSTYLTAVGSYYTAKGKVADLKLASQGSAITQIANTAQQAASIPPSNLWLIGGLGVLAVVLLSRR